MQSESLLRRLGLKESTALVIGTVIGTGVFLKTAVMAQQAGTPQVVLIAWAVAGALSLAGALTYAELGCLFPKAGGEYVYLREAYGPLAGFLYGWTRFWIASPGSIAAYAVGAATFSGGLISIESAYRPFIAVAIVFVFTSLNCLSVAFGGRVQTVMTALKLTAIIGLTAALFIFSDSGTLANLVITGDQSWTGWSAFGAALLAALWAFDGWNNLPMAAGEVRDPGYVLPRALGFGMLSVFLIYAAANVAYFYALPFSEIVNSNSTLHPEALPVATRAAEAVFGPSAVGLLSLAFVLSAIGAMNGSILTGARVPYAMACDGLFFKRLAKISPGTHVPVTAVIVQGIWSCVLALSGTFDQLTDYVVFSSWIFYALTTAAIFIFRRRLPGAVRNYQTPLYPWLPIVFLICSVLLLVNTLYSSPRESFIGLVFIGLGLPVYFVFRR